MKLRADCQAKKTTYKINKILAEIRLKGKHSCFENWFLYDSDWANTSFVTWVNYATIPLADTSQSSLLYVFETLLICLKMFTIYVIVGRSRNVEIIKRQYRLGLSCPWWVWCRNLLYIQRNRLNPKEPSVLTNSTEHVQSIAVNSVVDNSADGSLKECEDTTWSHPQRQKEHVLLTEM